VCFPSKTVGFSTSAVSTGAATNSALMLLASIGPASAVVDVADVLSSFGGPDHFLHSKAECDPSHPFLAQICFVRLHRPCSNGL